MMKTRFVPARLAAASLLLLGLAVGACSDDNNDNNGSGGPPASADYKGLVASTSGETGPLSITFASPVSAPPALPASPTGPMLSGGSPVAASGTFYLGGTGPIALTGTLDSGQLSMTGSGWTFTGTLADGEITGSFTGPGGESGSFAAIADSEGNPVAAYCGSYAGTDFTTDPASSTGGTFSVVIAGTVVLGTAYNDDGSNEDFSGTANTTAKTFTIKKTTEQGTLNASGSYSATSISGTWNTKVGSLTAASGEFGGGVCSQPT